VFTPEYWKKLVEDAVSAFAAGVLVPVVGDAVDAITTVNAFTVDYKEALGYGAGAALLFVLKGLAARKVGNPESPRVK
jgi:hypothetical protein